MGSQVEMERAEHRGQQEGSAFTCAGLDGRLGHDWSERLEAYCCLPAAAEAE